MARTMKDSGVSWIGQIPADWELVRTKHCYSNQKEVVGEYADDYQRLALTLNGVIKRPKDDSTGLQPEAFNSYQVLRENELVFKLIDLANVATSRVGYSPYAGIVSPAYIVLHPRKVEESRFGKYFFLSMWQREVFNHMGDDGVRSSLNASDLLNVPYILAPSVEKKRIVEHLDKECHNIDPVIEQTRASIEEYKKLKQTVITQAVTKGIHSDVSMKDSGIEWLGDIPAGWSIQKTKSLSKRIVVGVVIKPADYFNEEGTVPFLRGINVKEYTIHPEPMVYIDEETNKLLSKSIVHTNDLLIVRDGSIGTTCVVPAYYDGANVVSMIIATCCAEVSPEYLCYSFNSDVGKTQFNLTKIGTALTHTSVHSVSNIFHVMPTYKEQLEIAEYLETEVKKIDSLIDKKRSLLSELESYKKSLIFEYVTGKKEVPA